MISELTLMELASDQQKIQKHAHVRFPCSTYYNNHYDEIITIADLACGFSNTSHFCRIFRQHMGCSPQEFRKNNN